MRKLFKQRRQPFENGVYTGVGTYISYKIVPMTIKYSKCFRSYQLCAKVNFALSGSQLISKLRDICNSSSTLSQSRRYLHHHKFIVLPKSNHNNRLWLYVLELVEDSNFWSCFCGRQNSCQACLFHGDLLAN